MAFSVKRVRVLVIRARPGDHGVSFGYKGAALKSRGIFTTENI